MEGIIYHCAGPGSPQITNTLDNCAILRATMSSRRTSLESVRRHLPSSRHPVTLKESIWKRLADAGKKIQRHLRRLPLNPHHRKIRLDFCRPRSSWKVLTGGM
ncbi:HTH_Tnp_Tc3_2 domain-containing protein [Trichonephila clavipes]|nr:HTH_Tnp_Tc3_2 domain-containing protein [Trichonephila clavipes]